MISSFEVIMITCTDCTSGSTTHSQWLASGSDLTMSAWLDLPQGRYPARGLKSAWIRSIHAREDIDPASLRGAMEWHVYNANGLVYVYTRPNHKSGWFIQSVYTA